MPNFDEQRQKVDQLDAKVRFAKQSADLRQTLLENELQMRAKSQKAHREFGEKWVKDRIIKPAYDRIDEQEAAYEAAQEGGEAPPPVPPNQGMMPVRLGGGVGGGASGGGPEAAASIFNQVNGGGPVQAGGEDFFNLNAQDPTEGGKKVGNNFAQLPSGQITETTVRPLQTGLRAIDTINALSTLFTGGRPLMKETFTTERPDMVYQAYSVRADQAAAAAAAIQHRRTEDRMDRQEDRMDEQLGFDRERFAFEKKRQAQMEKEYAFKVRQESRQAARDAAADSFARFDDANTLRAQHLNLSKNYVARYDALTTIMDSADTDNIAGAKAMWYGYARFLNGAGPLSNQDVAKIEGMGSWADFANNYLSTKLSGLPDEKIKQAVIDDVQSKMRSYWDTQQTFDKEYKRLAKENNLPEGLVVTMPPPPTVKVKRKKNDFGDEAVMEVDQ